MCKKLLTLKCQQKNTTSIKQGLELSKWMQTYLIGLYLIGIFKQDKHKMMTLKQVIYCTLLTGGVSFQI